MVIPHISKEKIIDEAQEGVPPRKISNTVRKALVLGFLLPIFVVISAANADQPIDTIQVTIIKKNKNDGVRARIRAQRKIYRKLVFESIDFPKNITDQYKLIIRTVYYQNYINKLKIKQFKHISTKEVNSKINVIFSYERIVLPSIQLEKLLNLIGTQIINRQFQIKAIDGIELSLRFSKYISLKHAVTRWKYYYPGALQSAFDNTLVTNLNFLKLPTLNLNIANLPVKLSELIKLNDSIPFNPLLCLALVEKLFQSNLTLSSERVTRFCLRSGRNDKNYKKLVRHAIRKNFISIAEINKDNKIIHNLSEEKKEFSRKHLNINQYTAFNNIVDSLGKLPIHLPKGKCDTNASNVENLLNNFENKPSIKPLFQLANWLHKNNFLVMHKTIIKQLSYPKRNRIIRIFC